MYDQKKMLKKDKKGGRKKENKEKKGSERNRHVKKIFARPDKITLEEV